MNEPILDFLTVKRERTRRHFIALVPTGLIVFDLIRKQIVKKLNCEVKSSGSRLSGSVYASEHLQRQTFTFCIIDGQNLRILIMDKDFNITSPSKVDENGKMENKVSLPEKISNVEVLSNGFFVSTVKGSWALYDFDGFVTAKGQTRSIWSFPCNNHGNHSYFIYKISETSQMYALEIDKQTTTVKGKSLTPFNDT